MDNKFYTFLFYNGNDSTAINIEKGASIKDLIKKYFERKEKVNLLSDNFENTYFHYNGKKIKNENSNEKLESFFQFNYNKIFVEHLNYKEKYADYEEIKLLSDNPLTSVYKAKLKGKKYPIKEVAIKKIKKDRLKEELKYTLKKNDITEEDFEKEIIKFNRELKIMQMCYCENSVEIYDYFDTKEYFIIIMELCDNNLLYELNNTKTGFNVEQIKDILLQLNNVFKIMHENHIVHRDIKLYNILIKYIDDSKKKFKVLLSDYGVSNQLYSISKNYTTHAGTPIIMAPEILEGEDKYDDKCDIWSLGVTIYYLHFNEIPYDGACESRVLKQIKKLGQNILDKIEDEKLKDLLSKMLVFEPEKRISWEDYFKHPFFQ